MDQVCSEQSGSADMSLISFMGRDVDVRWEIAGVRARNQGYLRGVRVRGSAAAGTAIMLQPFGIGCHHTSEVELGRVHASERVLDEGEGDEC